MIKECCKRRMIGVLTMLALRLGRRTYARSCDVRKKQIPRWIKNLKTDAYGITSGNCPECGCEVFQENDTYCPDCGQALKWIND